MTELNEKAMEVARKAFGTGGPGVLRRVQHVDSYPGERVAPDDPPDPEAYNPIKTSYAEEMEALENVVRAYLGALDEVHVRQLARLRISRHTRPWRSITVKTITAGQPRPYADTIDTYEVTFEGGHPSTVPGMEIAHGVARPFDREKVAKSQEHVVASTDKRTLDERERDHYAAIKAKIRPFVYHAWDYDATAGEKSPSLGAYALTEFRCIDDQEFSTTYRLTVCVPFMG